MPLDLLCVREGGRGAGASGKLAVGGGSLLCVSTVGATVQSQGLAVDGGCFPSGAA